MQPPVFERVPGILWRRVADEAVALAPAGRDVVGLSPTAAVVWEFLAEPIGFAELTGLLAEASGHDEAVIREDVSALLDHLVALGLARGV